MVSTLEPIASMQMRLLIGSGKGVSRSLTWVVALRSSLEEPLSCEAIDGQSMQGGAHSERAVDSLVLRRLNQMLLRIVKALVKEDAVRFLGAHGRSGLLPYLPHRRSARRVGPTRPSPTFHVRG